MFTQIEISQQQDGYWTVEYQTSAGMRHESGFPDVYNALRYTMCELGVQSMTEAKSCLRAA